MINDPLDEVPYDKAIRLQNGLISRATGGGFDDRDYKELRSFFLAKADTKAKTPDFVRQSRDLDQFWAFIKNESPEYEGRRIFIWKHFHDLIEYLENRDRSPADGAITEILETFDPENVHAVWQKALDRRVSDPEGAITAARTLLETVCKHILDDAGVPYSHKADLPKLWSLTAEQLKLLPNQHEEEIFKAILGNCQSVVAGLGSIRNRIGDAHGQGRKPVKPKPKHAELAVNLAGTMASFLIATWNERPK